MSDVAATRTGCHAAVAAAIAVVASIALAPTAAGGDGAGRSAPAVTIKPVVQSVPGKPGRYLRKFELRYLGPNSRRVSIGVEELDLMTGRILQAPANGARNWVRLDRDGLTLRRGARRTVRAVVRVPRWHGRQRRRIGVVFTISSAAGDEVALKSRIIASIHVFARPRG